MPATDSGPERRRRACGPSSIAFPVLLVGSSLAALLAIVLLEFELGALAGERAATPAPWWRSSLPIGLLGLTTGALLLTSAAWTYRRAVRMLAPTPGPEPESDRAPERPPGAESSARRRGMGLLIVAGFLALGGVVLAWGLLRLAIRL